MHTKIAMFQCQGCGWHGADSECPDCGDDTRFTREVEAEYVSVAMYQTDRQYGGPEEGGWYYTTGGRIDSTVRCFDLRITGEREAAEAYRQRLVGEAGGERDLTVRYYLDRLAPAQFPSHRPRYS
jgi:hypothetical protein